MTILERQFPVPTHVAWPIRLSQEAAKPWEAGACLLLAAHRWFRLRIAAGARSDDPRAAAGRFQDLLAALPGASDVDGRLATAAGRFLDPSALCRRTDDETRPLVDEIAALLAEGLPADAAPRVMTTGPSLPGRVLWWRGPGGHGTGPGALDATAPATWLDDGDDTPRRAGPATADTAVPYPLLPCPAPRDRRWFECPHGALYDADGARATPLGALAPGRVLGRLVAWALTRESDGAALAERLAAAGMAGAAAELWVATTAARLPRFDAQAVAATRAFFEQHRIDGADAALDAWLLREMDLSEARLREAGDLRGLTDTLLARQQLETGEARSRTLRRVANLFRDHLEEPESAVWCLLSHLEDQPSDEAALADLVDLLPRAARPGETASRLQALAATTGGAPRSRLARAAADAWQAAGLPAEALAALELALGVEPSDEGTVRRALALAGSDPDARVRLLALRRDAATDPAERADACIERAGLLAELGRVDAAREDWRQALALAPERTDAFDALAASLVAAGDCRAAAGVAEDLAARLLAPGPRAHVLQRLAGMDCVPADRAEAAMAEALALQPGRPELAEALAAIYAGRGAWHAHLAALGRLAAAAPGKEGAVLMRMAEVAADRMDDPLAALAFLSAAANRDPDDPEPRRRTEALRERLGLWAEVARDLEARAQAPGAERLAALLRLADVYEQRLALRERTKETLWAALREAPPEAADGIARRLAALHREDGERGRELDALEVAVRVGGDDEATAELLVAMGQRALESPAEPATARRHLEAALRLNPVHPVAIELACGLWLEAGHPERVVAAIEPLARQAAADGDTARELRLRRVAADAASRCDDVDRAVAQWTRVAELAPEDRAVSARLGRLLARQERHAEAVAVLAPCLEAGCDDRDALLRVAADCALRIGEPARALAWLEAAGGTAEPDLDLLRSRVEAAARAGDAARHAAHLEPLAAREAAGPARFACLVKLGDLHREALGDPAAAVRWYKAAAAEGVSSKTALHKALDAAVAGDDRTEALSILQSMLAIEPDGKAQARLHHAAALLARETGDTDRARDHLVKAVDLDPDLAEAVDALLEALADDPSGRAALHDRLARHYRVSGQGRRLEDTLRRLGALYLELHNPARAVDAMRQVLDRVPDDLDTRATLADTLTRMPGREADALEVHRTVAAADPTRVESYRAIRDLCLLAGDEDGAWCAAGALTVLGRATEDEKAAFELRRQPTLRLRRDTLPPDGYVQWIRDDGATEGIARVLSLLYGPLAPLLPLKQPADLGLDESDRVDLEGRTLFAGMAQAASRVFGVRLPRVYHAKGRAGFAKAAFNPPALVVGDDVLTAWRGKELRFALGRAAVAFAPGHELAGVSDAAGIRLFFLAGLRIAFPDFQVPADAEGVEDLADDLARRLSPAATAELRDVLTRFRQQKRAVDIQAFLAGVDRAAARAGLFLANDIGVAAAQLQEDALGLSDLEYGDRLVDLCAWSVSARHAELRRAMLKPFGE